MNAWFQNLKKNPVPTRFWTDEQKAYVQKHVADPLIKAFPPDVAYDIVKNMIQKRSIAGLKQQLNESIKRATK